MVAFTKSLAKESVVDVERRSPRCRQLFLQMVAFTKSLAKEMFHLVSFDVAPIV
jgi:hypothetical protein